MDIAVVTPDSVRHALQERDFEHNGRDRSRKEGTLESSQPESFKFPALVALMKHSDEETRAMAESVLWAYFPDEPTNNYPQAVKKFLAGN
jgi:hypothetical protein